MKRSHLAAALFFSAFNLPPSSFGQGSLTPPGPPGPTMKALDQIASTGIAINATNTPGDTNFEFIIAQAGSYYLTGNLNVAKDNGIHVTAAGVTVDLNGFQIARTSGSGFGILVEAAANNCAIRNGSITGFLSNGIFASTSSRGGAISHVTASNCSVGLVAGSGWRIDNCNAHDNFGFGIGTATGCTVSYCTASNNAGTGFNIGAGCTMLSCSASNNQGGFGIATGNGCALIHCTARNNTSASSVSAGISTGNGCTIEACTAELNTSTFAPPGGTTGAGIIAGGHSKMQNCSAALNKGDGVRATNDCSITANACSGNGLGAGDAAGIHVTNSDNRIEGNNVTGNIRGIDVDVAGNLIIKNSASGNNLNWDVVSGNVILVVSATTAAAVSGNSGGTAPGSIDPNANFTY
jgi:parallel beta-helix repeat protein